MAGSIGVAAGATIRMWPLYRKRRHDGGPGAARGLVGKLLILRSTTRGLCRPRLCSAGGAMISIRTSSCMRRRWRGGKRRVEGQMPPDHPHGVQEGQPVRVAADPAAGFVHQLPRGEMDQQQAIELDRKSTRLNSSHANISYAVFCL